MPRPLQSLKPPSQIKISGRTSSITNAFINGIMPFHKPTAQEMLNAVTALGMTPEDVRCSYCGDEATEWDHLNPFIDEKASTGYFTEIANLVPACGKCNQSKGNKPWKGWIRSAADLSPASRKTPDLERRIELLEAYEERFRPTLVKIEDHIRPELWSQHLRNHATLLEAMKAAHATAEVIRMEIAGKFRRAASSPVPSGNGALPRTADKFLFDGQTLGKGRLVLAAVGRYVAGHPGLSFAELKSVFPDSLQGSRQGVFTRRSEGLEVFRRTGRKRYFLEESEALHLVDAVVAVSTQWGNVNFPRFLARIRDLGYSVASLAAG